MNTSKHLNSRLLLSWFILLVTLYSQPVAAESDSNANNYQCEMPEASRNNYYHTNCLHDGLSLVIDRNYHKKTFFERFFTPTSQKKFTEKHGFVDITGKLVIPLRYDNAGNFFEGMAEVNMGCRTFYNKDVYSCVGGNWGFINKTGEMVIPAQYQRVTRFYDGLALVSIKGKYGFIDKHGKPVIPIKYEQLYEFQNELALAKLSDSSYNNPSRSITWQFIDKNDTPVITLVSQDESLFLSTARLEVIKQGSKLGYVNESGEVVIEPQFDQAEEFRYMQVTKNIGAYDRATGTNVLTIEDLSTGVNIFIAMVRYPENKQLKGIAKVTKNGLTYYIDQDGNKLEILSVNSRHNGF